VPVVEYGFRRILIVVGVMMAALLQTLDATIVNVALPTIEGNIGASIDDGTWVITGYIISNVVAIPLAPYLLARLGRRQYFAISIIGFTVASFFCGTATSLGTLVLYRIIQGAFGGGLVATSQIILRDTFPPEKLGASSALFAIALTVGPALGPTLGGILTDQFAWPWVFDINLVPGAIAATIILTSLRNPSAPQKIPFDLPGLAFLTVGLGALQYVLDEGERNDWLDDSRIVAFVVTSALGLIAFVVWELVGTKTPIVDLRIFRHRNVRFGVPVALMLGVVIFGPVVMLPQYVQNVLGFTATLSGLLILMRALPVMLFTPLVARLATKVDPRLMLTIGFALNAIAFVFLSLVMTPQTSFGDFIVILLVSGFGQSMLLVPLLVAMIGNVPPADAPKASSFVSLSVQLGGSFASTILVTIFDRRTYLHSQIDRASASLSNPQFRELMQLPHALANAARLLAQQSANGGFADSIAALVPVAVVALVPVWFLRVKRAPGAPSAPVIAAE
jgi:DHA2 family multidrug resistance protein